jgi:hypothetical protein
VRRHLSRKCALWGLCAALSFGAIPAWAQTPPPAKRPAAPEDESAKEAAKLAEEGQKAAKANKWEEARNLFLKAYKLKPSAKLAADLARADLGAQKHREAAELVMTALEDKTLAEADRKALEDLLTQAKSQLGSLRINVRPRGAEVIVGGVSVGTAPLAGPIIVDPGAVLVEAKMPGYFGLRTTKTVAAGAEEVVELTLHREGPADIPPPPSTSVEGMFQGVSMPIVISGGAVSAAGLLAGFGFMITSFVKAGKSHSLEEPGAGCGTTCKAQFDDLQKQKVTFAGASMWSFIGAGAVALGTGTYVAVTVLTKPKTPLKAEITARPDRVGAAFSLAW